MAKKTKAAAEDTNVFTVRIPENVSDANGGIIASFREIQYRTDRGDDLVMARAESQAFNDFMLSELYDLPSERYDWNASLCHWWRAFIESCLRNVTIGSEEFRQSRAGLIHPSHMRAIRTRAVMTKAEFESSSLAEVFDLIGSIKVREHNAANAAQKQTTEQQVLPVAIDESATKLQHGKKPKDYSSFREPQEWLRLRKLKGLSNSRNVWPALVKKHDADIHCESTKSAQISFELAQEWSLDLPEFRAGTHSNAQA